MTISSSGVKYRSFKEPAIPGNQENNKFNWIVITQETLKDGSAFRAAKRLGCKEENRNFTNGEFVKFLAEFYLNAVEPTYFKDIPRKVVAP